MKGRRIGGLWLIVAAYACAAPPVTPAPPRSVARPPAEPAAFAAPPAPTAAAPAGSVVPAPPPAPTRDSPTAAQARAAFSAEPTPPPAPKGPGVRCGDLTCRPGWLCCLAADDTPRCLPQTRAKSCKQAEGEALRGCDDAGDCGAGNVCCQHPNHERSLSCRAMKDCVFKLCARGDTCLDDDYVCLRDGSSPIGGQCVYRKGTAECGSDQPCSGDTPWCLWDRPTQAGECIEPLPDLFALRCTSEKDCPNELACCWMPFVGGDAFCGSTCLDLGSSSRLLCSEDRECVYLTQLTAALGNPRPWTCEPVDEGEAPPGVRVCTPPD